MGSQRLAEASSGRTKSRSILPETRTRVAAGAEEGSAAEGSAATAASASCPLSGVAAGDFGALGGDGGGRLAQLRISAVIEDADAQVRLCGVDAGADDGADHFGRARLGGGEQLDRITAGGVGVLEGDVIVNGDEGKQSPV